MPHCSRKPSTAAKRPGDYIPLLYIGVRGTCTRRDGMRSPAMRTCEQSTQIPQERELLSAAAASFNLLSRHPDQPRSTAAPSRGANAAVGASVSAHPATILPLWRSTSLIPSLHMFVHESSCPPPKHKNCEKKHILFFPSALLLPPQTRTT